MIIEDIREIKGVIGVLDIGAIIFLLLCFTLALLISYVVYVKTKQRLSARNADDASELPAEKPFDVLAEEALDRLDPVIYFEKGKLKEYYFEITEIIRQFLAKNYHIDTYDRTSYEIISEIERVERDYEKVKNLDRYLRNCDLVKFAKHRPTLTEMREVKGHSSAIIKEYFRQNALR